MQTLQVGSISHGTLIPADLIDAMLDVLDAFPGDKREVKRLRQEKNSDWNDEIVNNLIDRLQEYAPDFCYVGMHPGDGSDLGVWIDWDSIENARQDGDLPSGDSLPERNRGSFLVVNDHGNATLYQGSKEIWAVV